MSTLPYCLGQKWGMCKRWVDEGKCEGCRYTHPKEFKGCWHVDKCKRNKVGKCKFYHKCVGCTAYEEKNVDMYFNGQKTDLESNEAALKQFSPPHGESWTLCSEFRDAAFEDFDGTRCYWYLNPWCPECVRRSELPGTTKHPGETMASALLREIAEDRARDERYTREREERERERWERERDSDRELERQANAKRALEEDDEEQKRKQKQLQAAQCQEVLEDQENCMCNQCKINKEHQQKKLKGQEQELEFLQQFKEEYRQITDAIAKTLYSGAIPEALL